jgi:hypothetical protein
MPHGQLSNFISQFQIGLAIEENINDNKKLTISNKIIQYLQAGIPVMASNTEGHREVANYFPEMVSMIEIENTCEIVQAIDHLKNVSKMIMEQHVKFNSIFSWEAQEEKLNSLLVEHL